MAEFHVAHRMHQYTIIPRVLYVRRWGLKRWGLAFGKSGRITYVRRARLESVRGGVMLLISGRTERCPAIFVGTRATFMNAVNHQTDNVPRSIDYQADLILTGNKI